MPCTFEHWVRVVQVVVYPHDPARVVLCHELQVAPDALEVALGLAGLGVDVAVEGEADDALAGAAAERVLAARRRVVRDVV